MVITVASDLIGRKYLDVVQWASVRTGAMGAQASIDFEQRVPGTRPEINYAPIQRSKLVHMLTQVIASRKLFSQSLFKGE